MSTFPSTLAPWCELWEFPLTDFAEDLIDPEDPKTFPEGNCPQNPLWWAWFTPAREAFRKQFPPYVIVLEDLQRGHLADPPGRCESDRGVQNVRRR